MDDDRELVRKIPAPDEAPDGLRRVLDPDTLEEVWEETPLGLQHATEAIIARDEKGE